MREGHRDLRDPGQMPAELLEDALEHWHQKRDQRHHHADRKGDDERGVDHGRFDLAAQRGVLLELVRDPYERALEQASQLAGLRHGDEQRVEHLGVAFHCPAQRQAGLDIFSHADDRLFEERPLGLDLEHVQRPQDAHARGDHGRELAREDGEFARLHALHERQLDLA